MLPKLSLIVAEMCQCTGVELLLEQFEWPGIFGMVQKDLDCFQAGIEEGELIDLIEDGAPSSSLPHLRPNRAIERPRLLPRTRASERVRARITRSRQLRAANVQNEREQEALVEAIAVSIVWHDG